VSQVALYFLLRLRPLIRLALLVVMTLAPFVCVPLWFLHVDSHDGSAGLTKTIIGGLFGFGIAAAAVWCFSHYDRLLRCLGERSGVELFLLM